MRDYRRPFALVSKEIPEEGQQFKIQYSAYGKVVGSYVFKNSDSNLLIDIDSDNVNGVAHALEKENIGVNDLYVIPSWEIPDAGEPMLETFLHRALWKRRANVFQLLLQKGANPRIKGHCHSTVIDDLFDGHTSGENVLKFGKMLVDAGVKPEEIKKRVEGRKSMKEYKPYIRKLIHYAETKRSKVGHKGKIRSFISNLIRVKD